MPRWCNWTWACVHASVAARSNVAGLLYSSAKASASSRDGAMSVEKVTRALAPGASRTRRRRLTIGSSTAPTVLESGWPARSEQGAEFGSKFGLHEQVGKRRVGEIGGGWRQDDFGV